MKKGAGKHIEYHKDGSVQARGQMRDGTPVGYWEWFRKSGTRMRSGSFDDAGKQIGEWITYDQEGAIYKVTMMSQSRAGSVDSDG